MVKLGILLAGYCLVAPLVGVVARRFCMLRWGLFVGMIVITALPKDLWTVMVESAEWYRGHTRGYPFTLQTMAAIALLVACGSDRAPLRPALPMTAAYVAFMALSGISIFSALSVHYGMMALWKYPQFLLVFLAAHLFFRTEKEHALRLLFGSLVAGLCLQVPLVAKQRFLGGMDQALGGFEHQNILGMWAYLAGLPLLGLALGSERSLRRTFVCLAGVGAGGIAVLFSLSRAAVAIYAVGGTVIVLGYWIVSRNKRGGIAAGALALSAVGALVVAWPAISDRFRSGTYLGGIDDLRAPLNRMASAMLADAPMSGVGWNNFGLANSRPYPKYTPILEDWHRQSGSEEPDPRFFRRNPLPENVWWVALGETGFPGAVGTALLMAIALVTVMRAAFSRRPGDPRHWFFAAMGVAICLTYLHTWLERILMTETPVMTLWLVLVAAAMWHAERRVGRAP